MRDKETASIGIQASLTGHLVLSTLHTNTAVGAVTRLRDMGVAPYLLKAYSEQKDITLFSYSAGHTTANITPLTSLAIFVAAGLDSDLADLYNTWKNYLLFLKS